MARTGAQRYAEMAEAYVVAASAVLSADDFRAEAPFHMLVAHATELALKSLLLSQGDDAEYMIMIGHSLDICWRRAVRLGLIEDAEDIGAVITALNIPHSAQSLRYPGFTLRDLPEPRTALAVAVKITHSAARKAFQD